MAGRGGGGGRLGGGLSDSEDDDDDSESEEEEIELGATGDQRGGGFGRDRPGRADASTRRDAGQARGMGTMAADDSDDDSESGSSGMFSSSGGAHMRHRLSHILLQVLHLPAIASRRA